MKIRILKGIIRERLRIKNVPEKLASNIIDSLTYPNPDYEKLVRFSPWGVNEEKVPPLICLAERYGRDIIVPRGFDPHQSLNKRNEVLFSRIRWEDRRLTASVKPPRRYIDPNSAQKKLLEAFTRSDEQAKRPFGNYLLVAPTSGGKTIAQAMCATATKQRTLVLFVTNLIKRAWMTDLMKLYALTKHEIGTIQQKTWKIGEHFTLASVATLALRKDRWDELFDQIGCVVLDEVQKISEPRIYDFITSCPSKYIIGASATPGESEKLYAAFGTPIKRLRAQHIDTESSIALKGAKIVNTDFRYEYDRVNLDFNDLLITIGADEKRNKLIVDNAVKDWELGKSVMIVVKRKQHMWMLYEMLHERGVEDANVIYGTTNINVKRTSSLIEQVLTEQVRMLVGIDAAVKLGANLNPLNSLHVAVPCNRNDIEQLIGRIRRRAKMKTTTTMTYYLDGKVSYLKRRYINHVLPVLRVMKAPGFENLFTA